MRAAGAKREDSKSWAVNAKCRLVNMLMICLYRLCWAVDRPLGGTLTPLLGCVTRQTQHMAVLRAGSAIEATP